MKNNPKLQFVVGIILMVACGGMLTAAFRTLGHSWLGAIGLAVLWSVLTFIGLLLAIVLLAVFTGWILQAIRSRRFDRNWVKHTQEIRDFMDALTVDPSSCPADKDIIVSGTAKVRITGQPKQKIYVKKGAMVWLNDGEVKGEGGTVCIGSGDSLIYVDNDPEPKNHIWLSGEFKEVRVGLDVPVTFRQGIKIGHISVY